MQREGDRVCVQGIEELMNRCYEAYKLPYELGVSWAHVSPKIEDMQRRPFGGIYTAEVEEIK